MKRVEMYGDQRELVEWAAKKLRADGYDSLAGSLDILLTSYDAAEYETGSVIACLDYKTGYVDGYEDGREAVPPRYGRLMA